MKLDLKDYIHDIHSIYQLSQANPFVDAVYTNTFNHIVLHTLGLLEGHRFNAGHPARDAGRSRPLVGGVFLREKSLRGDRYKAGSYLQGM